MYDKDEISYKPLFSVHSNQKLVMAETGAKVGLVGFHFWLLNKVFSLLYYVELYTS